MARALGCTVSELLNRISSEEFTEWMAYYSLEPWGTEVDMYGHGIVASTVANVNIKKGRKPFQPKDFIPDFEKSSKPQGVDEMVQFAEMMTVAMGGVDKRKPSQ